MKAGKLNKVSINGFTLLEVLLALVIFSMLSLCAYSVLQGVVRNNEVSEKKIARIAELQRAMSTLARDFSQAISRPSRINNEINRNIFQTERFGLNSDDGSIIFIRAGWLNPGGLLRRSELQKVGYRLNKGVLERLYYLYPDVVTGTKPSVIPLLTNVSTFSMRFFKNGTWLSQWLDPTLLPSGIEITLTLDDYGIVTRRFLLATTPDSISGESN